MVGLGQQLLQQGVEIGRVAELVLWAKCLAGVRGQFTQRDQVIDAALGRADEALYAAKAQGRNRIVRL